ncbi:hypothetical protein E3P89_01072 [Wallemia ichthyophaga]|uniref:FAD-binding domain-containing protein n=1 Tax=Wallemia ichthyophaga TaxID=245174 RepID=A0A4T0G614_WALIC|nr:hypothetical protein E3P95_03554 [Wallemia ichthyophaga]TIA96838.1 hypothetical protein E3P94_03561 [Wallemia ichthyophaga]TIB14255.1 hypothetical protein E3P90_01367 [Wallemia ichthyophaga]TIB16203.1 hypothetical protein E3P93_01118 [Wallemia ichthyophaga]TIB24486.1 hypothetical protein E3P89_01072 [Wallemia ichthyophaga]
MTSKQAFNLFSKVPRQVTQTYDVLIVGGGPVGLALASSLGSCADLKALKIGLIEANSLDGVRNWNGNELPAFSNRCSSISASNYVYFQLNNMQVWDGRTDARITFGRQLDDEDYGALAKDSSTLSYMMENTNLQKSFLDHIDRSTSIDILDSAKIRYIDRDNEWPRVNLEKGDSLRTRLIIGADGFNSPVRKFSEIEAVGWSYNAAGFVSTLETQPSHNASHSSQTAFQRFLPTGPIAYLPLPGSAASMVWSTTPELANKFKQADIRVLGLLINAAFRFREDILATLYNNVNLDYDSFLLLVKQLESAQGIDMTTSRQISNGGADGIPPSDHEGFPPLVTSVVDGSQASFPLKLNHTDGYDGNRAVLVGDAAHSCHPLAGQGLNLGMGDVQSLTSVLAEGQRLGGDIGSKTILERYTRDRYLVNLTMLMMTDKLNALFQVSGENPLVQLRSMGLEMINEIDRVKEFLVRHAGTKGIEKEDGDSIIADGIESVGKAITMLSATARQVGRFGEGKVNEMMNGIVNKK